MHHRLLTKAVGWSSAGGAARTALQAALCLMLGAGVLLSAGCGAARTEYDVAALRIDRGAWDSLTVSLSLAKRRAIGAAQHVAPDTAFMHVFGAAYDTLYSGATGTIHIDDAALGDQEAVLIEACAVLAGRVVCEQGTAYASPKRLQVAEDISFPEDEAFRQGSYDLSFVVERQRFDGPGWERIEPARAPTGYLLAYVAGEEGGAIRIPFSERRGRFNLARYRGYDDFKYYLESKLFDSDEASVSFDVYASLGGTARQVAGASKVVGRVTREERLAMVRSFAEQAAAQLVQRLGGFLGGRSAVAYVDDWSHDRAQDVYTVQMEVRWEGAFSSRERYALQGVLEVDGKTRYAQFRRTDSNRRAARRWHRRTDGEAMDLGQLEPLPTDDLPPRSAAASEYNAESHVGAR